MEIKGRLIQVLDVQSGTSASNGNQWQSQEFILEYGDQYPKKVCLKAFGDRVNDVANLKLGSEVTASVNPESREYNGRWYTTLMVWRLGYDNSTASGDNGNSSPSPDVTNSSAANPDNEFTNNGFDGTNSGDSEDLPF